MPDSHLDYQKTDKLDYLVIIGSSAGGLVPMMTVVEGLPALKNLSILLVPHLSPIVETKITKVIEQKTGKAVEWIETGTLLKGNKVYLLPPSRKLVFENDFFLLSPAPDHKMFFPIDQCMKAATKICSLKRIFGIILSGSGSDGSRGVIDLASHDGMIITQKPSTAEFSSMPDAAIRSGVVAAEAIPTAIPQIILSQISKSGASDLKIEAGDTLEPTELVQEPHKRVLYHAVKDTFGIDLAFYNQETIDSKITTAIRHDGLSIKQFIYKLQNEPNWATVFVRGLFDHTTSFAQNAQLIDSFIEQVLPDLVAKAESLNKVIRIWNIGCSTGQNTYALAIKIEEYLKATNSFADFKIYSTDLFEANVRLASKGIYPEFEAKSIPEEYAKHLEKAKGVAKVGEQIRKKIIFAKHDAVLDAPFLQVDTIFCCNVLEAFSRKSQKSAVTNIQFSLGKGGYLFSTHPVLDLNPGFRPKHDWGVYECLCKPSLTEKLVNDSLLKDNQSNTINVKGHEIMALKHNERKTFEVY